MRVGQALQRLLLTATYYNVKASFLTQQLEEKDRRMSPFQSTQQWWRWPESPQMIIRVGGIYVGFGAYQFVSRDKADGTGTRTGSRGRSHHKRSRKVTARVAFGGLVILLAFGDGCRLYYNMQHGKNQATTLPSPRPSVPDQIRVQPGLGWSAPLQVGQTAHFVIPLRPGYSHAAITFSVQDADTQTTLCAPDTTLTVAVGQSNVGKVTLQPEDWTTTVDVTGYTGSVPVQLTVGNTMSSPNTGSTPSSQNDCPVLVGVPNVTLTNH